MLTTESAGQILSREEVKNFVSGNEMVNKLFLLINLIILFVCICRKSSVESKKKDLHLPGLKTSDEPKVC